MANAIVRHSSNNRRGNTAPATLHSRLVANKEKLGIDVINLSLGHPILEPAATDPLVQAVEAAVRDGIVVVCSAGNVGINPDNGQPGYAGITSPGNAPSAITVGAVDTMDTNLAATTTEEETMGWAQSLVWGDNIVWGGAKSRAASVVAGENIVWADNIVWGGMRSHWANSIIWGDNIVWGDSLLTADTCDGDNIVWGGRR